MAKFIYDINKYAMKFEGQEFTAVKTGYILAKKGREGEEVRTYTKNGILETIARVRADEEGAEDYVVTRCDENGKPVVGMLGRPNCWILSVKALAEKYDIESRKRGVLLCRPKRVCQKVIQIPDDISFRAPWGNIQTIRAGGYLNVTDPDAIYGIAKEKFRETYELVNDCSAK